MDTFVKTKIDEFATVVAATDFDGDDRAAITAANNTVFCMAYAYLTGKGHTNNYDERFYTDFGNKVGRCLRGGDVAFMEAAKAVQGAFDRHLQSLAYHKPDLILGRAYVLSQVETGTIDHLDPEKFVPHDLDQWWYKKTNGRSRKQYRIRLAYLLLQKAIQAGLCPEVECVSLGFDEAAQNRFQEAYADLTVEKMAELEAEAGEIPNLVADPMHVYAALLVCNMHAVVRNHRDERDEFIPLKVYPNKHQVDHNDPVYMRVVLVNERHCGPELDYMHAVEHHGIDPVGLTTYVPTR